MMQKQGKGIPFDAGVTPRTNIKIVRSHTLSTTKITNESLVSHHMER